MQDTSRGSLKTYLLYLLTLVATIIVLGATGFYFFERGVNENVHSFWDSLWWTFVTISTIGYGDIYPHTVGGRCIAIFLVFAGVGTLGVSTAAISAYFIQNNQLQLLRIRGLKDHVVICGLGDKGVLLARAFREQNLHVVIIEKNEENEDIETCIDFGALIFIGDATEKEMLARVRVPWARHLVAVCGDDGANAEIAAHARDLATGVRRSMPLTCSIHIVTPELWHLLRRWEIATEGFLRLQFFNVLDLAARALLGAYPPFESQSEDSPTQDEGVAVPHLLIVGAGRLGCSLAIQTARLWRRHAQDKHIVGDNEAPPRLRITLVDRDIEQVRDRLYGRNPGLERLCDLDLLEMNVRSSEFSRGAFLYDTDGNCAITSAYVCLSDDTLGLTSGLALVNHARKSGTTIVVLMKREVGLARLVQDAREGAHVNRDNLLHAFGVLEHACHPELVLGGVNEVLARALHSQYLQEQRQHAQTRDMLNNPSFVPWERLPEDLRESNRSQAGHIGQKLHAIGCDIAPLSTYEAPPFRFTEEEIDQMAHMEHDRWVAERRAQGWTYGPERNNEAKTNPSLVSWERLSSTVRKINEESVAALPELLGQSGFTIYRFRTQT